MHSEGRGKQGITFHVIYLWMWKGVTPYQLLKFGLGIKTHITIDFKMFSSFHHEYSIQHFLQGHMAVATLKDTRADLALGLVNSNLEF